MNIIDAANVKQIPVFKFIDSLLKYQVNAVKDMTPKLNVKNLTGHIVSLKDSNPNLVPCTKKSVIGIAIPYINNLFPFRISIFKGPYNWNHTNICATNIKRHDINSFCIFIFK